MKTDSRGQLILVDRPLHRTMMSAPKAHYFSIEQGLLDPPAYE